MNIYPRHIGTLPDATLAATARKNILREQVSIGEVYVAPMFAEERIALSKEVQNMLSVSGFRLVKDGDKRGPFGPYDYTYGMGSIGLHEDDGYGWMALVLLGTAPMARKPRFDDSGFDGGKCHLFAGKQSIGVDAGDVILLNADLTHGWMANCKWVLATFMIKQVRTSTVRRWIIA